MEMNPALRRGLMRANPGYFSMSIEEQERYRVSMPDEDVFTIEQQVFRDLVNINVSTPDEWRNAHEKMPISELDRFNEAIQPIKGVGDDYLWLNEYLGDRTLLDFETLHDHDAFNHAVQLLNAGAAALSLVLLLMYVNGSGVWTLIAFFISYHLIMSI